MSSPELGFIFLALLMILIFLGVHVAFALIIVGFFGLVSIMGYAPALSQIALVAFDRVSQYELSVIPLFIFMGMLVSASEIGKECFDAARAWIGQARGGLAMATLGACGLMAACTGSSLAGTLTMGKVAYPEMMKFMYSPQLAAGCVAAGGTVGILIPPSLGFILYGILTQNSIGKLFLAGIIPGILQIVIYIVVVYILCRIHPSMGPAAPKIAFNQKVKSLGLVWPALLLFFLVIGGMYGGVFTATEAGAVGAFGALILSLAKRSLKLKGFWNSLTETAKISGIIILLLIGAYFFNGLLSVSRIPNIGSEFLVGLGLNKYVILTIILVIYVIMGMFFDSYSILVITVPVLYPAILAFGFDPIWYGVIMVRVIEMGLISPPFGINDFALSATANIPINKVYRGVIPFLISDVFNLIILVAIPVLSTYLPYMMITKS